MEPGPGKQPGPLNSSGRGLNERGERWLGQAFEAKRPGTEPPTATAWSTQKGGSARGPSGIHSKELDGPRDKWRLHRRRRPHTSGLASRQKTRLHRRPRGWILAELGGEERGFPEEAESAGPARLGQSACTPPDNWPISARGAREPERIILGKGAEAGDCGEGRCVARSCVRPPAREAGI